MFCLECGLCFDVNITCFVLEVSLFYFGKKNWMYVMVMLGWRVLYPSFMLRLCSIISLAKAKKLPFEIWL